MKDTRARARAYYVPYRCISAESTWMCHIRWRCILTWNHVIDEICSTRVLRNGRCTNEIQEGYRVKFHSLGSYLESESYYRYKIRGTNIATGGVQTKTKLKKDTRLVLFVH